MELSVEQKKELEVVERFHIELKKIDKEVRKIIVGQKEVVDQVMISLLTGGNSIITGRFVTAGRDFSSRAISFRVP